MPNHIHVISVTFDDGSIDAVEAVNYDVLMSRFERMLAEHEGHSIKKYRVRVLFVHKRATHADA